VEKGRIGAHYFEMAIGSQTTVIFRCPKCGLLYQAVQERRSETSAGRFDCTVCLAEIYAWSGDYDYNVWKNLASAS
jgi:predicted RNA-binding Zn-ribbon protein involved in translation (DUF1610 family)